ncbi:hypothetical protein FOBRF1_006733 [Fusarium oxysporum]
MRNIFSEDREQRFGSMETYNFDKRSQRTCVTKRHLLYNYYCAEPSNDVGGQIALLLHGHGDYSYGWRYTIPILLSHNIRCIIPDLLGFGGSSKPVSQTMYRLKAMSQDMMEVLSHAGLAEDEKFIVIGHDWGSILASRVMLHHPARVSACVSITGTYIPPLHTRITMDEFIQQFPNFSYWKFFAADGTPSLLRKRMPVFWNAVVRGAGQPAVPMSELEPRLSTDQIPSEWLSKPHIGDDRAKEAYLHAYWRGGWEAPMNWYKAFLDNFEDENGLDHLALVQTPFLTILGKFDPAVPPEAANATKGLPIRSSTKILPSGHWAAQEDGVGLANATDYAMNQLLEQSGTVASHSLLSPPVPRPQKSCSQCRTRKVKCDMNFPRCGGCTTRDIVCEFTARRKPGPPKGVKRKYHQRNANAELVDHRTASDSPAASSSDGKGAHAESLPGIDMPMFSPTEPDPSFFCQSSQLVLTGLENYCIDAYPSIQHFPYLPPLSRSQIFATNMDKHVRSVLIQSVCAISVSSASGLIHMSVESRREAASTFAKRAKSAFLRLVLESEDPVTLATVKIACILSAYELTCSPSNKGWYMVGEAVRLAYDIGLDHIDSCQQFDAGVLNHTEIEEQRYVWWCVYALDTYASATLMRPFGITDKVIRTAFVGAAERDNPEELSDTVFLPSDPVSLQIAIESLDDSQSQNPKVLMLLLLSILRQVLTVRRQQLEGEAVGQNLDLMRNLLASYWFSLPGDLEQSSAARGHPYDKRPWIDIIILAHLTSLSVSSYSLLDLEGHGFGSSSTNDPTTRLSWGLDHQKTSLSSWNKCVASSMGILGIIRNLSPEDLSGMSPFCIIALWLPAVVLAFQMRASHDENKQNDAESALHVLKAALKKLAKVWNVAHRIEGKSQQPVFLHMYLFLIN